MKHLRLLLVALIAVLMLVPAAGAVADTNVFDGACAKQPSAKNSAACTSNSTSNPLTGKTGTLTKVTAFISYLTGVAVVIMLIVGGFMYVTSNGDAGKVASARETVVYALVGIVIVVFAQAIIIFVLNRI